MTGFGNVNYRVGEEAHRIQNHVGNRIHNRVGHPEK